MTDDWIPYVEEFGEELTYAALSLVGMEDDMAAHFVIEIKDVEFIVTVRKHTDGYYDKLASSLRKPS